VTTEVCPLIFLFLGEERGVLYAIGLRPALTGVQMRLHHQPP
jgi:hypothetical protein